MALSKDCAIFYTKGMSEFSATPPERYKVCDEIISHIRKETLENDQWEGEPKYWKFQSSVLVPEDIKNIEKWCENRGVRFYSLLIQEGEWMLGVLPPPDEK